MITLPGRVFLVISFCFCFSLDTLNISCQSLLTCKVSDEKSAHSLLGGSLVCNGASLVAQMVKNPPAMRKTWVRSLGQEDPLEREWQPAPVFLPGEFHGRGAWQATVHRIAKSQT